jgi:glycosyltransferase involved in cell wall biosynthesis
MKITLLLPFLNHRGGTQLVMDLSDHLCGLGDDVAVVWPTRLRRLPGPLNEIEYLWRAPWKMLTTRWFRTRAKVVPVPSLVERYIPAADVVVATQWQTAAWAATYGPTRGRKAYLVFEPEVHHDPDACAATYRLPFDLRLAISEWTRDQIRRRFGQEIDGVTPLGLDHARYPDRPRPPRDRVEDVGMVYDPSPKKAFEDGYQAFCAARGKFPQLRLHLLSVARRPPSFPPFVVPHFRASHQQKVAVLHRTDVWLSSSREDGWGLTPMEAMACGNAVLTTRVGGTPYFARDGETALVVEPGDAGALAHGLERLIQDRELRHRLVASGTRLVRGLTLAATATSFRDALARVAGGRPGE